MLSKRACNNLDEQGFTFLSEEEKNRLNIALRVTPAVCIIFVAFGLYYQSFPMFAVLSVFGILGVATRRWQPLDALYNISAKAVRWPQIPPSPLQKRLACGVGTLFMIGAAISAYLGNALWVYIFGGAYILAAGLMALTHFCIASWLYNRARDIGTRSHRAVL